MPQVLVLWVLLLTSHSQDLFIARLINGRVHGAEEIRYPPHIGGDLLAALPRTVEQLCNFTGVSTSGGV